MPIERDDVNTQVEMIWDSTLQLPVQPLDQVPATQPGAVVGSIHITGAWEGAITLVCDDRLARQAAAVMFGLADHELTREHVLDAIGELTNMAGGNLKALLPGPCQLSLPQTAVPTDSAPAAREADCVAGFLSHGQSLVVSVAEDATSPAAR
jgi:chemotaxis protein CheY-P-specific phosphatase CheC